MYTTTFLVNKIMPRKEIQTWWTYFKAHIVFLFPPMSTHTCIDHGVSKMDKDIDIPWYSISIYSMDLTLQMYTWNIMEYLYPLANIFHDFLFIQGPVGTIVPAPLISRWPRSLQDKLWTPIDLCCVQWSRTTSESKGQIWEICSWSTNHA
jgi:hypothetical protein